MKDVIEVETGADLSASVIWLHGLGADGNDFVPVVPALALGDRGVRFLFPHAPVRPVTVNGGMPMRAWYDILAMGAERQVNEEQLLDAAAGVSELVRREVARGVPASRIFLVGFSQGGAVAYQSALSSELALAGLAVLSTYRVNPVRFPYLHPERRLRVFGAHGRFDEVVPLALGQRGLESLQAEGLEPEWYEYPMAHEVCLEQVEALGDWLTRCLGEN